MAEPARPRIRWNDLAEVALGACIIGFPVAASEAVWSLSLELSIGRVLTWAVVTVLILSAVVYSIHRDDRSTLSHTFYLSRVAMTYSLTMLISAMLLLGVDRLDLFHDPIIALKRTIIVAFPASLAATLVDGFSHRS